jgi:hypothetical protein
MMSRGSLFTLLALSALSLSACVSDPRLGAGVSIGPGGLSISPQLSGNVGGVRVGISP